MKQLEPGMVFGNYNVIRKLGEGGMGEVWLLRSRTDDTPVAAKFLNQDEAVDHESRLRFVREAELAMNIRHENVVSVYDVGEDPDTELCYILMEYVPGGTLADYLNRKGSLSVEDAVSVVHAIAKVLVLAHARGIVHRDIKPANIMFAADGTPKLADLGIARSRSGGNTTTVTQTGIMIGTPAYMSPEQMLDSHAVDIRADIYSLGIVFYEMLTGSRPYPDASVAQLMSKAVAHEPIPDIRQIRPDTKPAVAHMINFMCAPIAANRVSSPQRIVEWCEKILSGERLILVPRRKTFVESALASKRKRMIHRRTSSTWLFGGAFILIAFGVGFASSSLMNHRQPMPPATVVPVMEPLQPIEVELEPEAEENAADEPVANKVRKIDASLLADPSSTLAVQKTLNELFPGWHTSENLERAPNDPGRFEGYVARFLDRQHCVCTHPVSREKPQVTLSRMVSLSIENPVLRFSVAAHFPDAEIRITARVNGTMVWEGDVAGGKWHDVTVDLSNWAGLDAQIELCHRSTGWYYEWAYWSRLEVGEWDGREKRVFRPHPVDPLLEYHLFSSEDPTLAVQRTARQLFPGWEVSENGPLRHLGYHEEFLHRHNVLLTYPPREGTPAVFSRFLTVPTDSPELRMEVASHRLGDFEVEVLVDGQLVCRESVEAQDNYKRIRVPLGEWAGSSVKLEIRHQPTGWKNEHAFWSKLEVVSGKGVNPNREVSDEITDR